MDGTGGIEDGEGDVMISESFGGKGIWTGTAGGERGVFLEEKNCFGGFGGDFHSGGGEMQDCWLITRLKRKN